MFLMFSRVTGGMMAVAQLGVIAKAEAQLTATPQAGTGTAIRRSPVSIASCPPTSRCCPRSISRTLPSARTMVIAFTLEGLGIIALGYFGHNPWAFLILSGVVFLAWGEV
jgi:hypothetical protein